MNNIARVIFAFIILLLFGILPASAGDAGQSGAANGNKQLESASNGHYDDLFYSLWIGIVKSNQANKKFENPSGVVNAYFAQLVPFPGEAAKKDSKDDSCKDANNATKDLFFILEGNVRLTNENEYNDQQKVVFGAQNSAFDISMYFPVFPWRSQKIPQKGDQSLLNANLRDFSHGPSIMYSKSFFSNPSPGQTLNSASLGAVSYRWQHDIGTFFEVGGAYIDYGAEGRWGTRVAAQTLLDAGKSLGLFLGGQTIFGVGGRSDEVSVYLGVTITPQTIAGWFPGKGTSTGTDISTGTGTDKGTQNTVE